MKTITTLMFFLCFGFCNAQTETVAELKKQVEVLQKQLNQFRTMAEQSAVEARRAQSEALRQVEEARKQIIIAELETNRTNAALTNGGCFSRRSHETS